MMRTMKKIGVKKFLLGRQSSKMATYLLAARTGRTWNGNSDMRKRPTVLRFLPLPGIQPIIYHIEEDRRRLSPRRALRGFYEPQQSSDRRGRPRSWKNPTAWWKRMRYQRHDHIKAR
jgi:hypothetical protein